MLELLQGLLQRLDLAAEFVFGPRQQALYLREVAEHGAGHG
jgi:hypothetical protein